MGVPISHRAKRLPPESATGRRNAAPADYLSSRGHEALLKDTQHCSWFASRWEWRGPVLRDALDGIKGTGWGPPGFDIGTVKG